MSKDIHSKIETALKDAISYHNDGATADEAVSKSASLHELNPETINRVVEAFNIAKTRAFVKKAEKRDGDFDTADKKNVQKMVFGDKEKTASVYGGSTFGDSFFKLDIRQAEQKVASAPEEHNIPNIEEYTLAINHADRVLDHKREKVAGARETVFRSLSDVITGLGYLREEEKVAYLDACAYEYDGVDGGGFDKCIETLNKVANLGYSKPDRLVPARISNTKIYNSIGDMITGMEQYKTASVDLNETIGEVTSGHEFMENELMKAAGIDTAEGAASLLGISGVKTKVSSKMHGAAEDVFDELFGLGKSAAQETKTTAASLLGRSKLSKSVAMSDIDKLGSIMSLKTDLGSMSSDVPLDPDDFAPESASQDGYMYRNFGQDTAIKSEIDKEIAAVRGSALLQDLMQNDDIISQIAKEDPKSIVQNYNLMRQIAPRAAQQKEIVRATLRYATGQSIDPNYASQLVDLDNKLEARAKGVIKLKG